MFLSKKYKTSTHMNELKVEGYPHGWHTGSTAKAIKFVITKTYTGPGSGIFTVAPTTIEYLPLEKDNSLPINCPFLLFTVWLRKQEHSSVYDVMRVFSCKPRVKKTNNGDTGVAREDILKFIEESTMKQRGGESSGVLAKQQQHNHHHTAISPYQAKKVTSPYASKEKKQPEPTGRSIEPTTSSEDNNNNNNNSNVQDRLNLKKKLPAVVTSVYQVTEAIKSPKMKQWIVDLVTPCFKSGVYYELLRYFSGIFLDRFTENELVAMRALIREKPYAFCFRSMVLRTLCEIQYNNNNNMLFPREKMGRFFCARDYCKDFPATATFKARPNLTRLLTKSPMYYHHKYPFWSAALALYAGEDNDDPEKSTNSPDVNTLITAMGLYLQCESSRLIFGNMTYNLRSNISNNNQRQVALNFLDKEKLLVPCLSTKLIKNGATTTTTAMPLTVTYPEDELTELEIACVIEQCVHKVTLYDTPRYDDVYFQYISELVVSITGSPDRAPPMIISAGLDSAARLAKSTSFNTYTPQVFLKEMRETVTTEMLSAVPGMTLIVERIHKMDMATFRDILQVFEGNTECKIDLILFGDHMEHAIHPICGLGNLAQDFYNLTNIERVSIPMTDPDQQQNNKDQVYLAKAYKWIHDGVISDLDIDMAPTTSQIDKYIKSIQSEIKAANKNKTGTTQTTADIEIQVFCSTEDDKNALLSGSPSTFHMGDLVHVIDRGMIGSIKKAWQQNELGQWLEVQPKKPIILNENPYKLVIVNRYTEVEVITSDESYNNITNVSVEVVKKYPGAYVDHGVFYVTKSTRSKDLLSAIKYCRKTFKIFTPPQFDFIGSVYQRSGGDHSTDLFTKLSMIKNNNL
jgi:hypothetical protein